VGRGTVGREYLLAWTASRTISSVSQWRGGKKRGHISSRHDFAGLAGTMQRLLGQVVGRHTQIVEQ
jgi:hypothetical protein